MYVQRPMSAIPPSVQAVLDLFSGALSEVRFADVDASGLTTLASEVEAAAMEVEARQADLNTARDTLNQRQEGLLLRVQRALAYARVYAESDPELTQRLNAISLPRAAKRPRAEPAATTSEPRRKSRTEAATGPSEELAAEPALPAEAETSELSGAPEPKIRKGKRRESARTVSADEGEADALQL